MNTLIFLISLLLAATPDNDDGTTRQQSHSNIQGMTLEVTLDDESRLYCRVLPDNTLAVVKAPPQHGYKEDVFIPSEIAFGGENHAVSTIDKSAFEGAAIRSVIIPPSVRVIDDEAFAYCKRLGSVIIPSGVTRIGRKAFFNCKSLTSVTLPQSVVNVDEFAFTGSPVTTVYTDRPRASAIDGFENARIVGLGESTAGLTGLVFVDKSMKLTGYDSSVGLGPTMDCSLEFDLQNVDSIPARDLSLRLSPKSVSDYYEIDLPELPDLAPDSTIHVVATIRTPKKTKTQYVSLQLRLSDSFGPAALSEEVPLVILSKFDYQHRNSKRKP